MTGDELVAWRNRLGLTQRVAADRLGCGRRSLQNWETGSPIPRYIVLACLAVSAGLDAPTTSSGDGSATR